MDFTTKEIFKRYASLALGRTISPVFLNILVTSVCDMRCTHCFFTEELDDRPRKKLMMKADEIDKISRTLGGNLGVLVLAGGEPFTRKDLPAIVKSFYDNNKLDSVYLMSNGQIHQRIFPDVTQILEECPNLNVTVALGIDGLKSEHEKIRQKEGSWDKAIHTARTLQQMKNEQYPKLDIQTCTCVMHSNEETIFDWYDFLKYDLKPDKININYIRPPSKDPIELQFDHKRYAKLSQMILDDVKNATLKNNYGGKSGFFKAAVDIYMHDLITKTKEEGKAQLKCYAGSAGAVIYDNGVLSSCENKSDVLNLRDYEWDFQAAWKTDLMNQRRKEVADGCYCTHESNCFYPSLPLNPGHLVKIKKLEGQMKKAAKNMGTISPQTKEIAMKA
ncbi:MAG TPA: radical SAM protein [Pyrinomonadaceae bacterium]|nr:radical SAM protein [Pyrinomonadaceae bacterium]